MKSAIFAGHAAIPRAPGISDGLYDGSFLDIILPYRVLYGANGVLYRVNWSSN